jgi:effector-binding domain-containing protein
MLRKILGVLIALVAIIVVVGLMLPGQVTVQRSIKIDRPPSLIYATIDSFQLFPKWSPWQDLDPNMHQATEGPRDGVGAKLVWSGNDKVGTGSQTITANEPGQSVDSKLDFGKMGAAKSRMSLALDGTSTKVTWSLNMDLGVNPIAHYFGLAIDRNIGPDFVNGLTKLKALVEAMPNEDIGNLQVETVQLETHPVLLVSESKAVSEISSGYMDAYSRIGKFMAKNKLKQAGAPFGIEGAMTPGNYSFDAGIPVDRTDAVSTDGVRPDKSYAGKALKLIHTGPYNVLSVTRNRLVAYAVAHAYAKAGAPFFVFVDDPGKVPPDNLRTEVYLPID